MPSFPLDAARRRLIAVALLCLAAAIFFLREHHSGSAGAAPLRVAPIAHPAAAAARAATKPRVVVDVVGAVRRPGLYRLTDGARIADALARAGGTTPKADLEQVNLAAPVADGEQVLVAARGTAGGAPAAAGTAAAGPVSLSTATAEQLDALPGVGPVTAQKIIAYRQHNGPFTSLEALDAIPGIGPARIADLKGLAVP